MTQSLVDPPMRTYSIPTGKEDESTISLKIGTSDLRAQNLSLTTWVSSVVLASILHRYHIDLPKDDGSASASASIPVLELGAGTGVVGISAAALWRTSVVLTDLGPIVPGLETNVALNQSLLEAAGGRAVCGVLDWSDRAVLAFPSGSSIASSRKARVILAADTIYSPEHPELLASTILAWIERDVGARVFVTTALRVAYLDEIRELWARLEGGGLEAVEEGQQIGEVPDGRDDELLCEWSVWRWRRDLVGGAALSPEE